MSSETARLTLDLSPLMHAELKIVAARKRTTMRDYCLKAIRRQLTDEPAEYLTFESDPVLSELWENDDDAVYDDL